MERVSYFVATIALFGAVFVASFAVLMPLVTAETVSVLVMDARWFPGEDLTITAVHGDGIVEEFSNEPTIFFGKGDPEFIQARLRRGRVYQMEVYGISIPNLPFKRNIARIVSAEGGVRA